MLKNRIANPVVRSVAEWTLAIVLAFFLYFVFRSFFRTAHVTGNSMEPTLNHDDLVMLTRFDYILGEPKANDIVAFPYKENPSEFYIKRVIGIPGDVIDLQGYQFVKNNEPLDDEFSEEAVVAFGDVQFPLTVPEGYFFVLGDNRNNSKDSRFNSVGCIPEESIVGKVAFRVWPLGSN